MFFIFPFWGVWSPEEPLRPNCGCTCVLRWQVFDCEKPPTPSTTQEGLGMHHRFCMYSTHLFQLWSQKLAPLRHTGCKLLCRFSLHRYSSLQVNILSAYCAISHQATKQNCASYAYWTMHHLDIWIKVDQLDDTCFIIILLNMFQMLICPSSGASEYLLCCVGWLEACWCYVAGLAVGDVVSKCRLNQY